MGALRTAGTRGLSALKNRLYSMWIILFFVAFTLAEWGKSGYWFMSALGVSALGSVVFGVIIGRRGGFLQGVLWTVLGLVLHVIAFVVLGLVWAWHNAPAV